MALRWSRRHLQQHALDVVHGRRWDGSSQLRISSLTGTPSAPAYSTTYKFATSRDIWGFRPFGDGNILPQLGSDRGSGQRLGASKRSSFATGRSGARRPSFSPARHARAAPSSGGSYLHPAKFSKGGVLTTNRAKRSTPIHPSL